MPHLNPDILRDVFDEIVKKDGSFKNIDKFMMAGKEPFQLVLDICKKAKSVAIFNDKIVAKLPGIQYDARSAENFDEKENIIGTRISTAMALFKPISFAIASSLKSLDIRNFAPTLIPMLKSINYELIEINVTCQNLKAICSACANIRNVQNGVTIKICKGCKNCITCQSLCDENNFFLEMKSFTFPCQKLAIIDVDFNKICKEFKFITFLRQIVRDNTLYSPHLRKNIRHLTIEGKFRKNEIFVTELEQFTDFLLSEFKNLKTLNINFSYHSVCDKWDWNNKSIAKIFQRLPSGIKGCICFKIFDRRRNEQIDLTKYPGLKKNGDEGYYKVFQITDILSFKLVSETVAPELYSFRTHLGLSYPVDKIEIPPFIVEKFRKAPKFEHKNFPIKPLPIFKNQQNYKSIQNRFNR